MHPLLLSCTVSNAVWSRVAPRLAPSCSPCYLDLHSCCGEIGSGFSPGGIGSARMLTRLLNSETSDGNRDMSLLRENIPQIALRAAVQVGYPNFPTSVASIDGGICAYMHGSFALGTYDIKCPPFYSFIGRSYASQNKLHVSTARASMPCKGTPSLTPPVSCCNA